MYDRKGCKTQSRSEAQRRSRQFSIILGLKFNTLNVVGNSSVAVCTIWTYATAYCLVLFFIRRFMKVLKAVHRQTTKEFAISAYEDR